MASRLNRKSNFVCRIQNIRLKTLAVVGVFIEDYIQTCIVRVAGIVWIFAESICVRNHIVAIIAEHIF